MTPSSMPKDSDSNSRAETKRGPTGLIARKEDLFQLLVSNVKDYAIFALDIDGYIISWNIGAERMKGYRAEEIIGKHFSIFYPEQDNPPQKTQMELEVAIQTGKYEEEGIRIKKDGTTFWAHVVITALRDSSGKLYGFGKVTRDVTEWKKAEQAVHDLNRSLEWKIRQRTVEFERQAADLKRSNTELERFAHVASHDLKEPLRTITNYTQLLEQKYKNQLDEKGLSYLAFVTSGASRMSQLVDALLAYGKLGKPSKFEETDVKSIVDRVLADLATLIKESGTSFIIGPLPTLSLNRGQITRLFQNLIENAIKFRSLAAPLIEISARDQGNSWQFSIKDNGLGINPIYKEHIFEIFKRLHPHDQYPGAGIGLAICKRIVEGHGGKIWVESKPKEGSTFHFTLKEEHITQDSSEESNGEI